MKKNLFILFSIYFFVVQPVIVGLLRGQTNFFRLAAINTVFIFLIAMLQKDNKSSHELEKPQEKKIVNEAKVAFHDTFHANIKKEHKKRKELVWPTIISLLVAAGIFFMFYSKSTSPEIMFLFALSLGFMVFTSLTFMFKERITKSFWKLLGTKLYIILLIVSVAFTAYDYIQVQQDLGASVKDYIGQNLLGQEILPTDGYVFTGEGTLIGSGLGATTGEEISADIFSGMIENSDIQETTGTVLESSVDTLDEADPIAATTIGNQTLMDAVIYLLKKYEMPLSTKKDISFTYVSTKNPNYAQWRTAYANKMIGKTTNPSKFIVCESYIVMKGLLEKWNVVYTSTNVLDKFRAEAVKKDALNGCVKGKIVSDKTL